MFREVSYNGFDLSAQTFGPGPAPGIFDDVLQRRRHPKGSFFQACITAGDSVIDYTAFDTVVCVTPTVGSGDATRR